MTVLNFDPQGVIFKYSTEMYIASFYLSISAAHIRNQSAFCLLCSHHWMIRCQYRSIQHKICSLCWAVILLGPLPSEIQWHCLLLGDVRSSGMMSGGLLEELVSSSVTLGFGFRFSGTDLDRVLTPARLATQMYGGISCLW